MARFLCKQAKFEAKYKGASTGFFNPGAEAYRILGELNYGNVFAYLFRRFGYPCYGWDDYKELTIYYLTTSMDGVVLSIKPSVSTATSFGYMLRHDVHAKCKFESFKPLVYWTKKFKKWVAIKYRIIAFDGFYVNCSKKEIDRAARVWIRKNCFNRTPTQKDSIAFWEYKRKWFY